MQHQNLLLGNTTVQNLLRVKGQVAPSVLSHVGSRVHSLQGVDSVDLAVLHLWTPRDARGEGTQETKAETETQKNILSVFLQYIIHY